MVALAVQGAARSPSVEPVSVAPPRVEVVEAIPRSAGSLLLAWTRDGLRPGIVANLRRMSAIRNATMVGGSLDWLTKTRAPSGAVIDDPPPGYAIPIEVAVVDPDAYAPFVPPSERPAILELGPGEALLSQSAAELRRGGTGMELTFRDRRRALVQGVISDTAASGYEVVVAGPAPRSWRHLDRFALMRLGEGADRRAIEERVRRLMPRGTAVRLRAEGETPFLRYGDAVLPLAAIKSVFGEFSARDLGTGFIEIDRTWVRSNIRTAAVPLLGRVTCHRILFPQLEAALRQVEAENLRSLVNPEQYGGCYSPRYVDRIAGGRLSHHAWGIGIDVNVAENAFGTAPDQDQRLVKIFEDLGFTWGGRWLVPDGMHFEWVRFP